MKPIIFILTLFIFISPVTADIYKGVDAEGGVTYSDKETPDSKKIPTPSSNTVQMPKPAPKPAEQAVEAGSYSLFRITSPENNATIRSNLGKLSVSLSIEPELYTAEGHTISILIDGRPFIKSTRLLNIELDNIDRGSHSIKARVRDKQGKSIISSNSVRFHMKRLSGQNRGPLSKPGPTDSDGSNYTPGPVQPDGTVYTPGPQGTPFMPGPVIPPTTP